MLLDEFHFHSYYPSIRSLFHPWESRPGPFYQIRRGGLKHSWWVFIKKKPCRHHCSEAWSAHSQSFERPAHGSEHAVITLREDWGLGKPAAPGPNWKRNDVEQLKKTQHFAFNSLNYQPLSFSNLKWAKHARTWWTESFGFTRRLVQGRQA